MNLSQSQKRKTIDLLLMIAVITISCFFFRGYLDYGISFDEVFRRNNLIPFFNSDAEPYNQSIYNFPKTNIPLIYKNYISSVHLIPDLFWVYFDNYFYGLRLSYLCYFIFGAVVFYFGLKRINQQLAFWATLLAIVNPILFPEVRFGFANIHHFLFIGLLTPIISNYLNSNKRPAWMLFVISTLIFLLPNYIFYAWWIVAASLIACFVLYPIQFSKIIFKPINFLVIIMGFACGHINFLLYNIFRDFPSIQPLIKYIFNRDKYNEEPIDFSESIGFFADINNKITNLLNQYELSAVFLIILIAIIVCLYLRLAPRLISKSLPPQEKLLWFAPIVFLLTFIFILLSPNAHRSGHFIFLSPAWEVTIVTIVLATFKNLPKYKYLPLVFLLGITTVNFQAANSAVIIANKTQGEIHFSSAFFELNEYINEKKIKDKLVHLQWGFYAQLYFLNKGEITANSLVFHFMNNPTHAKAEDIFNAFFADPIITGMSDPLYFPLFTNWHKFTEEKFRAYVSKRGWKLTTEKEFFERSGKPVFNLYRLERSSL